MAVTDHKRKVTRVGSILDIDDIALFCMVHGHPWSDPPETPASGWGDNVDAGELRYECPCGRWKREVVDSATGEVLTRDYGGGTMLYVAETRAVARAEWMRRKRLRRRARVVVPIHG